MKQSAIAGTHSPSWPSKDNRTGSENGTESGCGAGIRERETEARKQTYREIAREFVKGAEDDLEGRIFRAISVSGDTRLRREAVRERRGKQGSYRAKTVAGVMQHFVAWFLDQQDLVLEFDEFSVEVGSSYDEDAARERYGRLRDFERGSFDACRESGDDLFTALLGLTASHLNANGDYRCPADHWREMNESWSNHVRQEVQRMFGELGADRYDPDDPPDRWWEYVRIVEPHKSGYAHHHIAVVTNFEISVSDFGPVIARHVEETPSASWEAHDMDAERPEDRCISVNRVDPEAEDREDVVGNLASYLASYLSEFSDDEAGDAEYVEMLDKAASDVMFNAVQWATGSRKIDFSNGGHALRRRGHGLRPDEYKPREPAGDVSPPESVRNTFTGETFDIIESGSAEMVFVEDRPEADPERVFIDGSSLEADRR